MRTNVVLLVCLVAGCASQSQSSTPDLTTATDLARPAPDDLAISDDLSVPVDLSVSADLAASADLSTASDLAQRSCVPNVPCVSAKGNGLCGASAPAWPAPTSAPTRPAPLPTAPVRIVNNSSLGGSQYDVSQIDLGTDYQTDPGNNLWSQSSNVGLCVDSDVADANKGAGLTLAAEGKTFDDSGGTKDCTKSGQMPVDNVHTCQAPIKDVSDDCQGMIRYDHCQAMYTGAQCHSQ